jgi:DNA-binding NarL/FixJ family response regulator
MTRLFLVDDHTIMRDGLRALLAREPSLQVVGEAGHGQELLDRLPAAPADVVLLDLNMPVLDGLATAQRLRVEFPKVKILVLSMLLNERYVGQLFEAGVCGYALKNDEISELVLGIQTVAAGRQFLCNELSLRMLNRVLVKTVEKPEPEPTKNPYNFSRREIEVLILLAEGLTTSEIAEKLFTSKRTIETHRQNMLEKSQARNAAALIKMAMSQGVLQ